DDEQQPGEKHGDETDCRAEDPVRLRAHDRAEIGGEGEQRPRYRLCGTVASEERVAPDPSRLHHLRLEQRQHHMAAAEDERARPVERIERSEERRGGKEARGWWAVDGV